MIAQHYKDMLGAKSVIRQISEWSTARGAEIGYENVFDYSLGNPSVPAPQKFTDVCLDKCRRDRELFERYLCPEMERRWKDTCCVIADRGLYVLLNTSRSPMVDFQSDLAYFLRENLLTAASSGEFTKTERFMSAVRQTEIGFELGMKRNPEQWNYRFDSSSCITT